MTIITNCKTSASPQTLQQSQHCPGHRVVAYREENVPDAVYRAYILQFDLTCPKDLKKVEVVQSRNIAYIVQFHHDDDTRCPYFTVDR